MSDSPFASFLNPATPLPFLSGKQDDSNVLYGFDDIDYAKQPFDFLPLGHGAAAVLAPHPDQFESELDSSLASFDAELSLLPVVAQETSADVFSLLRSDTPTCGPPSSFTVSSESVSGYESAYQESESFYNFPAQSPTRNYAASNYSYTQELDMDFKRMGIPSAADERKIYAPLPASPSLRSSPHAVPAIARYSPQNFSSRGSYSDYEPAQPQHTRISSSAASDYYPQASGAQISKAFNYAVASGVQPTVSPNSVSPHLPAVPTVPAVSASAAAAAAAMARKADEMPQDPKKKYQCPSCPRAFARAYNLKTHIQTHDPNRSKPYACHHKSCGRSFSRKHDLTRHLVSIHRSSESVSSVTSTSSRAIGVDKGPRSWCDNCGKSWVGKGKEKGCDCDNDK